MTPPDRLTVLCVEDEDSQLSLRKLLFEAAGFDFCGSRTGVEALDLFRKRDIDAVVLDYWLSGMKGVELAEEMKRERPHVPVIILSGFASLPGEGAGLVTTWFQKGKVEPEELVGEVRRLIESESAKSGKLLEK
jgi:DNA-binding NtrC family response regulator